MSHKDNMDLRNTGDGGWFYAEHELFSVFAPLIGPLGVAVYMAMCRLIPLAAVDPDRPVTDRALMDAACVSKGTATRMRQAIVQLGMVEETRRSNRRSSTFRLSSLRTLSLVGMAELRSRLGGPQGTTAGDDEIAKLMGNGVRPVVQTASTSDVASKSGPSRSPLGAEAPRGSGETGGPVVTTRRVAVETTLIELLVDQKRAPVVQKTPPVVQNRGSLKEEKEEDINTPLPPSQAKGVLDRIAASGSELSADELEELREVNATRSRLRPPMGPITPEQWYQEKHPWSGNTPLRPTRSRRGRRST